MKRVIYYLVLLIVLTASDVLAQHQMGGITGNYNPKDPALAALLSIQPLPFDIGNFYSGNWKRGIIYTTAELALFIPAAVLLGRNNWGWGMHGYSSYYYTDNRRSWTNAERNQFYYLLAGYVIVKIISAFDAGYSAEIFNKNFSMQYDVRNNSTALSLKIPLNK